MNDIKNAANNKNYVKRIFNIDQLIPIEIISTDSRYRQIQEDAMMQIYNQN